MPTIPPTRQEGSSPAQDKQTVDMPVYPEPTRPMFGDHATLFTNRTPQHDLQGALDVVNKPVHARVLSLHFYAIGVLVFGILSAIFIHSNTSTDQGGILPPIFRYIGYATAVPPIVCAPFLFWSKHIGVVSFCLSLLLINYGVIAVAAYFVLTSDVGAYFFTWFPLVPIIETGIIFWTRQALREVTVLRNPFDI